jgi:hypothetical protein
VSKEAAAVSGNPGATERIMFQKGVKQMTRIRISSGVLLACALALVGCHRTTSQATASNQGSGSQAQAQAASAQGPPSNASVQPANAPVEPPNAPASSSSGAGQSAPGGVAASGPPAGAAQATEPASSAQDIQSNQSNNQPNQTESSGNTAQNQPAQVTIPDGTPINIRLTQSLGSARSVSGQSFAATLDAPIVVDNAVVVPRGANVTGRVLYAKHSGRLKGRAELVVTLTSLEAFAQDYRVVTSRKSWRGGSHRKRDLGWIGGGGGGGALIGAVAGGGVGAAIGAGVGAGGGTVTAFVTGRKNILLPSETRLRFVLRRAITVSES